MNLSIQTEQWVVTMDNSENRQINKSTPVISIITGLWNKSPLTVKWLIKALAWFGSVFLTANLLPIMYSNTYGIPAQVSALSDKIDMLSEDISDVKASIDEEESKREAQQNTFNQQIASLTGRIDKLYDSIYLVPYLQPTSVFSEKISDDYSRIYDVLEKDEGLGTATLVAYDYRTGEKYSVERLADQKLLLPYTNNGQEIVFYGQFNENGQWDGECTLNVYVNDELILITDAKYKDGALLESKQVFFYELKSGEDVWAYSERKRENGVGIGDTFLYEWTGGYEKDFELDDATVEDVLYADEFITSLSPRLKGYYYGNTSNNLFNDDSGDAYMVYFFEDGTVRLLYSGNFKDGTFEDNTGNAWYIVKENNTDYMYYKGQFRNGKEYHNGKEELGPPPLTLEEIKKYIGDRQYKVELRWAGFDSVPSMVNMI